MRARHRSFVKLQKPGFELFVDIEDRAPDEFAFVLLVVVEDLQDERRQFPVLK